MKRLVAAGIGLAGVGLFLAACEPSPQDKFVAWCNKYEPAATRCECIGNKLSEDLSKEQFAKLMSAAKADTSPGGSFSDFVAVVTEAVTDGNAAVSLTAAAMTCR
ncbi:MAG: hypothetical protein HC826_02635 [Rhodospirillales bacterium]|nr:hypothetical protein [Rhodospirillales bacterium]